MASFTAEAPDPKTFKSWEDAFKYPIPTVRRMQQQLRGGISTNRERLRTLVGSSYRDLLSTADTIVLMDRQMQEVEIHLSDTSRRCNSSRLEKSFRNSSNLAKELGAGDREVFADVSQLYVLQKCPEMVSRILRKGGSVQLAAKVLVISRLLHKKLENHARAPEFVAAAGAQLAKVRQKLPVIINRQLASTNLKTSELVDAMCAYSLATGSSSASDILRHFHSVRQDALANQPLSDQAQVLDALQLWIRTLQDTRTVFPKQLGHALAKLKSIPILRDKDVLSIWECDFEVHAPWLGEDVQNFIPYLRHDDLPVAAAAQQLSSWAPLALKTLLQRINDFMAGSDDLSWVANLRRACLETLFTHYDVPGVRNDQVLNGLRSVFEEKLLALVRHHCENLEDVCRGIESLLRDWDSERSAVSPEYLWSKSVTSMDTSRGAKYYTQTLHSILRGQTESVCIAVDRYNSWLAGIAEIEEVINSMKTTKWEDYLDDMDEDSDDEEDDEISIKRTQILLKETDPNSLSKELSSHLKKAFEFFQSSFTGIAHTIGEDESSQQKSAFLLRVLREVKQHLPGAFTGGSLQFAIIPTLHTAIASPVIDTVIKSHEASISKSLRHKSPPGRALWDGNPELPVLPSPWTFKLARDLQHGLSRLGTDVWTPSAVAEMKKLLRKALASRFAIAMAESNTPAPGGREKVKSQDTPSNDGTAVDTVDATNADDEVSHEAEADKPPSPIAPKETPDQGRGAVIQQLFDLAFLDALLLEGSHNEKHVQKGQKQQQQQQQKQDVDRGDEETEADLQSFRSWLEQKSNLQTQPELLGRIRASAAEYRKKTALLFALVN